MGNMQATYSGVPLGALYGHDLCLRVCLRALEVKFRTSVPDLGWPTLYVT